MTIQGAGIIDLSHLSNLTTIIGNLNIQQSGLASLAGLDNLDFISGTLSIRYNYALTTLTGLENLDVIVGSLQIFYNFALTFCCPIEKLLLPGSNGVGGSKVIFYNKPNGNCKDISKILAACPLLAPPAPPSGDALKISPNSMHAEEPPLANIYPNPASNNVNILIIKDFQAGNIVFFDSKGRRVIKRQLDTGASMEHFDTALLTEGVYLVFITLDGENLTKRLIIQR